MSPVRPNSIGDTPGSQMERPSPKASRLGALLALAIALHTVESWIPPLPVPGAKIGLANIVTLLVLFGYGWRDALAITVLRQMGGSLLTGTFLAPGFFVGMAGGVAGVLAMQAARYASSRLPGPIFSPLGISCIGAIFHNLGQLAAVAVVLYDGSTLYLLPVLLLLALPSGVVTGLIGIRLLASLHREQFFPGHNPGMLTAPKVLPGDWIMTATAVILALGMAINYLFLPEVAPGQAGVTVSGSPTQVINLKNDGLVDIDPGWGNMVLEIKNNKIRVKESSCTEDVCIQTGWIEKPGDSIVCVPNRVVVRISGGERKEDLDAVTY